MVSKHYDWKDGPAELKPHSLAKHEVIQLYLTEYFERLCLSNWNREELRLSIVDAFSGGGQYIYNENLVYGSPLILLNCEKEARFKLSNSGRTKPFNLDVSYFFVDNNRHAVSYLKNLLVQEGYKNQINSKIHIFEDDFQMQADNIIAKIKKKSPKNGRSIFVLDQYGYANVPLNLISKILQSLPTSEIILTFAVDSLLNFVTDKNDQTKKILSNLDFSETVINELIKNGTDGQQRLALQILLLDDIVKKSTASYYTPFFVRGSQGHGSFWLLHLSQHKRARDVMAGVHWKAHNHFIHYGGAGLNMLGMLGYSQKHDLDDLFESKSQLGLSFDFDTTAREKSIEALVTHLKKIIVANEDGISLDELYATTCNSSPATSEIYKEAIAVLSSQKQVEVTSVDGKERRAGNQNIKDSDLIIISKQNSFFF